MQDHATRAACNPACGPDCSPVSSAPVLGRWRDALDRADAAEMPIVRSMVALTRFRTLRALTVAVNLLGNGWAYLAIAAGLFLWGSPKAWAVTATALAATAGSHAIYALVKRQVARLRPFERDPSLPPLANVLDRYSFPSGHCMTLTAVLVPIVQGAPSSWPYALFALALLAWCRVAAAHHYPSDVAAGICLGLAIATPLTRFMVPA
jgi:undecaprenyl-diphosphatase